MVKKRILGLLCSVLVGLSLVSCSPAEPAEPASYPKPPAQVEEVAPVPAPPPEPVPAPSVEQPVGNQDGEDGQAEKVELGEVPEYSGEPYVVLYDNDPTFDSDFPHTASEYYSDLDSLGRCGEVYACIGLETMPTGERESISHVEPSGWEQASYDIVDGGYLYNRSHLIGWQLTAENDNVRNLITGTRYMNTEGMLPFENMVADYIQETGNHVLYRVTPIYDGSDLVASGVWMEAESLEDSGDGICFSVYCYNVQPGVVIDYSTGDSYLSGSAPEAETAETSSSVQYIININSDIFHIPTCSSVDQMKESNKKYSNESAAALIDQGYRPCQRCDPAA